MESLIERAIRLEKEGIFLGGPAKFFKTAGRKQLTTFLSEGLTPCFQSFGYWLWVLTWRVLAHPLPGQRVLLWY